MLAANFVPLKAASGSSIRGFFAAAQPKAATDYASGHVSSVPDPPMLASPAAVVLWQDAVPSDGPSAELDWGSEEWQDDAFHASARQPPQTHVPPSRTQAMPALSAAAQAPQAQASAPQAQQAGSRPAFPSALSKPAKAAASQTKSKPHMGRSSSSSSSSGRAGAGQWQFSSQAASQQGVKRKPAIAPPAGGKQLKLSALLPRKYNK